MNEEPLIEGKQLTATEIEEGYRLWGEQVHKAIEPFLMHILKRCTELMVKQGYINDEEIQKIAEEEVTKKDKK